MSEKLQTRETMQARATWSALSQAQRRLMALLEEGRYLARGRPPSKDYYIRDLCTLRATTVLAILSRKLIESDNPSDPMKRLVLSDRGRFVLKHGRKETDKGARRD